MNIVNKFLARVGSQVVLTAQAMRDGGLDQESADKLTELSQQDYKFNNKLNSELLVALSGAGIKHKDPLVSIVTALLDIENRYYLSSIHNDLCRWVDINATVNSAHQSGEITEDDAMGILYVLYVILDRFTLFPTNPMSLKGETCVILSDIFDDSETDETKTDEKFDNPLEGLVHKLLTTQDFCEVVETASKIFDPVTIKLLDKEGKEDIDDTVESLGELIDADVKKVGWVDFRIVMTRLLLSRLKIVAEEELTS